MAKTKMRLFAVFCLVALGITLANPVQKLTISVLAEDDSVPDYEVQDDDIVTVASQVSENITYYVESSSMSALSLSSTEAVQYYTIDRLETNIGTVAMTWDFACPNIEQALPMAARKLNRPLLPGETRLWSEANTTVQPQGDKAVDIDKYSAGVYIGSSHKEWNMSSYDYSNLTLESKYSGFSSYYVKNNTRYDMESDVTEKQGLQTHLSGFASFEYAWESLVKTLLGQQHDVSADRIHITDYDANGCNMSTYYSSEIVDAVREQADKAAYSTSATETPLLYWVSIPGLGVQPVAGWGFKVPKLGKFIKSSNLIKPAVKVVKKAAATAYSKAKNVAKPVVNTIKDAAALVSAGGTDWLDYIRKEVEKQIPKNVGQAGITNPVVDTSYSDQLAQINAMLSKLTTHFVEGQSYVQKNLESITNMIQDSGKWTEDAFARSFTFAKKQREEILITVLIVGAILGALIIAGFLLLRFLGVKPIPA